MNINMTGELDKREKNTKNTLFIYKGYPVQPFWVITGIYV